MGKDLTCPFCLPQPVDIVIKNELAYARWDMYPVTEGHMLIIPHHHIADYFDATMEEKAYLWHLVDEGQKLLKAKYNPDGFNIGLNAGVAAGQTVMHVHIHLIPRRKGDMKEPQGGVRHVIPEKGRYSANLPNT
jgi:diadenosine tetraphosphate (Ap4A) HIT family hydrolase